MRAEIEQLAEIELFALKLANEWHRMSTSDRQLLARANPRVEKLLFDLHTLTRGDLRRCYCCSAPHHDPRCPAYRRT